MSCEICAEEVAMEKGKFKKGNNEYESLVKANAILEIVDTMRCLVKESTLSS